MLTPGFCHNKNFPFRNGRRETPRRHTPPANSAESRPSETTTVKRQKGAITWKGLGCFSFQRPQKKTIFHYEKHHKTPILQYMYDFYDLNQWQMWGVARNAGHLRLLEQHFEY